MTKPPNFLVVFRKYFIDKPTTRASHYKPKPTGAGIILSTISTIFFLSKDYYNKIINCRIGGSNILEELKSNYNLKL